MREFHFQIVTPDGIQFDGDVERIVVRTTQGDIGILNHHANYVAPISNGKTHVHQKGTIKTGICRNGMVSVTGAGTRIIAGEFEWEA